VRDDRLEGVARRFGRIDITRAGIDVGEFWDNVGAIGSFPTWRTLGVIPGERSANHRCNKAKHVQQCKGEGKLVRFFDGRTGGDRQRVKDEEKFHGGN